MIKNKIFKIEKTQIMWGKGIKPRKKPLIWKEKPLNWGKR
jgi:hypothetical protein